MELIDKFVKEIKEGHFPRYLYKFRKFDDFSDSIFTSKSLWFSDSESFNDPFDCNLSETRNHKIPELRRYLESFGDDHSNANEIIKKAKKDKNFMRDLAITARKESLKKYGILSLSESHENILMWSHYAENHTGFVMCFDLLKDPDYFKGPIRVVYQDFYGEQNYYKYRNESVIASISTKSSLWSYEREIRLIKQEVGLKKFDKDSVCKIYFGVRSEEANISNLKSVLNREGYNVKYFIAKLKHGKFELGFHKM